MRKSILIIFALITTIFASCDKVPINGALDGQWQIMEMEENGTTTSMKDKSLYCAFQLHVCMFGSKKEGVRKYFCKFEHTGNKMRFYTFTHRSAYTEEENIDKLITEEELGIILPWGFYSTDCTFDVIELNNSTMILSANGKKITYRKL